MGVCVNCEGEVRGNRPDSQYCPKRECRNARQRAWRKSKGRHYLSPKILEVVSKLEGIKSSTPCVDCGGIFPPECMDFDHLRDKVDGVSAMAYAGRVWTEIEEEIGKCELVCANCHRTRTRRRANNNDKGKWELEDANK